MKEKKGITLIALIITIIVMLILVAVTLTITLGENGIIAKVREAKQLSKEKEFKEKVLSCLMFDETGKVNFDETINAIREEEGCLIDKTDEEITVEMNGYRFTIKRNGEILTLNCQIHVDENNDRYCDECGLYIDNQGEEYEAIDSNVYVSYAGRLWIVLYEEGELGVGQGAQLISKNTGESITLGYNDNKHDPIIDNATNEQMDLDTPTGETIEITNFEKGIYSYNNAIDTLNKACFKDVMGQASSVDTNIIAGIRSVGYYPLKYIANNTINSETSTYLEPGTQLYSDDFIELLDGWLNMEGDATCSGKIKQGEIVLHNDYNMEDSSDVIKMRRLGIIIADDSEYFMAMRKVSFANTKIYNQVNNWVIAAQFNVCVVDGAGYTHCKNGNMVARVDNWINPDNSIASSDAVSFNVRPVIVLNPTININSLQGLGTKSSPYILSNN